MFMSKTILSENWNGTTGIKRSDAAINRALVSSTIRERKGVIRTRKHPPVVRKGKTMKGIETEIRIKSAKMENPL